MPEPQLGVYPRCPSSRRVWRVSYKNICDDDQLPRTQARLLLRNPVHSPNRKHRWCKTMQPWRPIA